MILRSASGYYKMVLNYSYYYTRMGWFDTVQRTLKVLLAVSPVAAAYYIGSKPSQNLG